MITSISEPCSCRFAGLERIKEWSLLFDPKFRERPLRYLAQCSLAFVAILSVLTFLNLAKQTTMVASFGASTFIVFAMPSSWSAQPRGLVGGYLVGSLVGSGLSGLLSWAALRHHSLDGTHAVVLFAALSVGLCMYLMVITNTEHPPAVGIALALVVNPWDRSTVLFLLLAASILALFHQLCRAWLIDLH